VPVAATLKVALWPEVIVTLAGCVVIVGPTDGVPSVKKNWRSPSIEAAPVSDGQSSQPLPAVYCACPSEKNDEGP
jgi:hypothetical protein